MPNQIASQFAHDSIQHHVPIHRCIIFNVALLLSMFFLFLQWIGANAHEAKAILPQTSEFELSKTLNNPEPVLPGQPISFTITITNTGSLTITYLPLSDTYDTNYLAYDQFGSGTPPDDQQNDGILTWSDLTATLGDLAPNTAINIIVSFFTVDETVGLAAQTGCSNDGETCTTSTVSGAETDADGPGGAAAVVIPSATVNIDVRIQDELKSTLGDYVWFDTNGNGEKDEDLTTAGINGVVINLYQDGLNGNPLDNQIQPGELISSTTTANEPANVDGDDTAPGEPGYYDFPISDEHVYLVEIAPSNFDPGGPLADHIYTGDNAGNSYNGPEPRSVVIGEGPVDYDDADFPFTLLGSIGDTIWFDVDESGGDQTTQGTEPGLPGVDVVLTFPDGTTITETTTITGFYLFEDLPMGTYTVTVVTATLPSTVTTSPTYDPQGPLDSISVVTLDPTTPDNLEQDFSYPPELMAVGNLIWLDDGAGGGTADNGMLDGTESGIDNVTVELFNQGDDPNAAIPVSTTTTSGGGFYQFDNLMPGQYFVHVPAEEFQAGGDLENHLSSTGAGTDETTDETGDENGLDDTNPEVNGINSNDFDLQPNSEVTGEDQASYSGTLDDDNVNFTADFGFAPILGSIGDTIWFDVDESGGDQTTQGTEPGLPDVDVVLTYPDGTTITETTTITGFYLFEDLPMGTYTVTVVTATLPSTVTTSPTYDPQGPLDSISVVTLDPTTPDNLDQDFSYPPELMAIGNLIWLDDGAGGGTADNGMLDGTESGIDNVTVELFNQGDDPNAATPVSTTTTSGGGFYQFDNLTPGQYFVHVPAEEFQAGGDLENHLSSAGAGTDETTDEAGDENGLDDTNPEVNGISSNDFDLQPNSEVTGEDQASYSGTLDDDNVNFTADFGFTSLIFDLALIKVVDPTPVQVGDLVTFTLYVRNQGDVDASNVEVCDWVPAGFVAPTVANNPDLNWNFGAPYPIYTIPDLNAGQTVSFTLVMEVDTDADATNLTNEAGIRRADRDDTGTPDVLIDEDGTFTGPSTSPPTTDVIDQLNPSDVDIDLVPGDDDDHDIASVPLQGIPSLQVIKTLNGVNPFGVNETISFTIQIINTGAVTLTIVPLDDRYNSTFMEFDSATVTPDTSNAGRLIWNDLTAALGDVAPGMSISLDVTFTTLADTTLLNPVAPCTSSGHTPNVVEVENAFADPDGDDGNTADDIAVVMDADDDDCAEVEILHPTAVTLAERSMNQTAAGVQLTWTTLDELALIGFNIRKTNGLDGELRSNEMIMAKQVGQSAGASYEWLDAGAILKQGDVYILEIVKNDGSVERTVIDAVTGGAIFLPMVAQ
ncbi:MAG: SdrD B-like domain-containing protein [Chloroflexota bacterium]